VSHLVAVAYPDLPTAQQVVASIGRAQAAHDIEVPGNAAVIALVREIPGRLIQTSLDNETEERLEYALAAAGRRA
jgi:uncharacterized membrane protein